jgi:hypothetical protein
MKRSAPTVVVMIVLTVGAAYGARLALRTATHQGERQAERGPRAEQVMEHTPLQVLLTDDASGQALSHFELPNPRSTEELRWTVDAKSCGCTELVVPAKSGIGERSIGVDMLTKIARSGRTAVMARVSAHRTSGNGECACRYELRTVIDAYSTLQIQASDLRRIEVPMLNPIPMQVKEAWVGEPRCDQPTILTNDEALLVTRVSTDARNAGDIRLRDTLYELSWVADAEQSLSERAVALEVHSGEQHRTVMVKIISRPELLCAPRSVAILWKEGELQRTVPVRVMCDHPVDVLATSSPHVTCASPAMDGADTGQVMLAIQVQRHAALTLNEWVLLRGVKQDGSDVEVRLPIRVFGERRAEGGDMHPAL